MATKPAFQSAGLPAYQFRHLRLALALTFKIGQRTLLAFLGCRSAGLPVSAVPPQNKSCLRLKLPVAGSGYPGLRCASALLRRANPSYP
jgi:hypothetical protein